jgi:hypothetical protein
MSDRRRRRPGVESLEGRMLLAGSSSPTSPVPIGPSAAAQPTQRQLGAAYRQVVELQTITLKSLGTDYRRVEAAVAQVAARVGHHTVRDRQILQQAAGIASRAEQGLDVARGVEDQYATRDKIYIPNRLFLSGLKAFLKSAQTLSSILVGSGRHSTDAVVFKLDRLGNQLVESAEPRP